MGVDVKEVARRAVTSPSNLASFGERGFRTVINGRVVDHLVMTVGLDRQAALIAAREAIEEVGGLVVGSRIKGSVPVTRLRPVNEVWMIPETAVIRAGAPAPDSRPRAA